MGARITRRILILALTLLNLLPSFVGATVRVESEIPRLHAALERVVLRFRMDVNQHFEFVHWDEVTVYGVENERALEEKRLALGLGKPPSWAFGVCYPASKVVIIRLDGPMQEIERTLVHELVHLIFGVGFNSSDVPSWFSEGVAQMFEGGLTSDGRERFKQPRLRGPPMPLDSLTGQFPDHGSLAQHAYLQAEQMTWFIHDELGRERFVLLIRSVVVEGLLFERAFESFLGYPLSEFEAKFVSNTQTEEWWHELFREPTLFTFTGILLILGGFRRRKDVLNRIRRLRTLEDAEKD